MSKERKAQETLNVIKQDEELRIQLMNIIINELKGFRYQHVISEILAEELRGRF